MAEIKISKLIRSNRRTICLMIDSEGNLIVKAPIFTPIWIINKFISDKKSWVSKQIEKKLKHIKKGRTYTEEEEFLFLGKTYKLHFGNFNEVTFSNSGQLEFPSGLSFRIKKEIERVYINEAKELITKRVKYFADLMKLKFSSITFSDTKSKWGTCTHINNLQFNWRLVMTPLLVIDYVIIHELAHIKEKNHSRRFWSIVSLYKPAFRQHRKWLNENSHQLTL